MTVAKPTIPEVKDRFIAYRARVGCAWGSLHIVLSDGNVSDSDVDFCIKYSLENDDLEGAELGRILRRMSRTQRLKMAIM